MFQMFYIVIVVFGGGYKILCSNKMWKKKFLFSLGIFQLLEGGKWVGFYCDSSVDSFLFAQ